MVARLSEIPAYWNSAPGVAANDETRTVGIPAPRLAMRGQLLLDRATSLEHVRAGDRALEGFPGIPLHIAESACRRSEDSFLRDRVFATVANDGAICLRLPEEIANDLIENGLCERTGKHLRTWPVTSDHQLENSWRILLHAYWSVTGLSGNHSRRLWSEFVIQH